LTTKISRHHRPSARTEYPSVPRWILPLLLLLL